MECEKLYVLGFKLYNIYVYNMFLFYVMKSDIVMNMNEMLKLKGIDNWGFFLDVNIIFFVLVVLRDKDSFICVLRIFNVICFLNNKNKFLIIFKNLICN